MLTWPLLDGHPVQAVVTSRRGGVSEGPYASLNLGLHVGDDPGAVQVNRQRAAAAIGLTLDDLVFCNQTHGRTVVEVSSADAGRGARTAATAIPGADALVTREAGVGLVVMVADCVPILLFDPVSRTLACVHAGWRGTVARVVEATIGAMAAHGVRAADLLVGVGPAIPGERYQVGEEVLDAARDGLGVDADAVISPDGTGRWRFDLWAANTRLLTAAGVPPQQISVSGIPTGPDTPFFSDRAQRPCGRFALLATLTP